MKMNNVPFLNSLYTKHDTVVLLDKLERLEESLYNVKLPFGAAVKDVFSFAAAEEFLECAAQANISTTNPEAIRKYLEEIKASIQGIPTASIRIAITPSNDTVKYISKWFDANMNERVVLDFVVDHTLIGGIVIEYEGKHADYSLKKRLTARFANQKQV